MIKVTGSDRVVRGGSWFYNADSCEVSSRGYNYPDGGNGGLGFRVLRRLQKTREEVE